MEENGAAVRNAESRAVADARVPHLVNLDADRLKLRFGSGDIGYAERDGSRRQRCELVAVRVWRHDGECDIAGLE